MVVRMNIVSFILLSDSLFGKIQLRLKKNIHYKTRANRRFPTRWQTNTLDRESRVDAAEGHKRCIWFSGCNYADEPPGGALSPEKTFLGINQPIAPQVLIGCTEVAARCHVTKRATSSTPGWSDGGGGAVWLLGTT